MGVFDRLFGRKREPETTTTPPSWKVVPGQAAPPQPTSVSVAQWERDGELLWPREPCCPYCNSPLKKPYPATRRKCTGCGQTMIIRTRRDDSHVLILTREQEDANRNTVLLVRSTWSGETDDGSAISGSGFDLEDSYGKRLYDGGPAVVFRVAGVSRRMKQVQSRDFAPGCEIALIREPRNPVDPNAVGIWDATRKTQVGYVPADECENVQELIQEHGALEALVLFEFRNRRRERAGLKILAWPASVNVEVGF